MFAREVRAHRERLGLSQAELLAKLHSEGLVYMNQTALSRLENGTRPARMIEAMKLAKLFGVPISALTNPDTRDVFLDAGCALHRRALDQRRQILTELKDLAQLTDDAAAALEGLESLWNLDDEDNEHVARITMVKKQLHYVASGHALEDVKQFVDRYVEGERDITSPRFGQ
ncbi:helix-turn-helix transcriptional regulator [Curtobacterium sp. KBS0715]|uniref:helix-turn-helix transcriptional regulator n=1 Tax=Curtobacterium sp. KBS0715 TaxID=1179671 RepID=UPI00163D53EE|nr:helix-turn-helix transcriptional regulator [Curtobacterium sp. KBS0715]